MGMKVLRPLLGSRGPQPAPFAPLRWGARASGKCCPSISFVIGVPSTGVYRCLGCISNITSPLFAIISLLILCGVFNSQYFTL